jgi:UDP-2,3-diacylglucosamine hydrolase
MTARSRPDRIYLISDLHLEEDRPALTQAFLGFLGRIADSNNALYILGDFFNLWIGDDDDRPLNATVCAGLKASASKGLEVNLMQGNRDFLLGPDFALRAGANLLAEPHLLRFRGKRYLLMHGDALCTRDTDYQAFRQMVHNPDWQKAFLAKPLAERRAFADQARRQSKAMSSNKADDIMDVSPDAVVKLMQDYRAKTLIHGHTHRPAVHGLELAGQVAERIVLGDWGDNGWFVELDNNKPTLQNFPIDSP